MTEVNGSLGTHFVKIPEDPEATSNSQNKTKQNIFKDLKSSGQSNLQMWLYI